VAPALRPHPVEPIDEIVILGPISFRGAPSGLITMPDPSDDKGVGNEDRRNAEKVHELISQAQFDAQQTSDSPAPESIQMDHLSILEKEDIQVENPGTERMPSASNVRKSKRLSRRGHLESNFSNSEEQRCNRIAEYKVSLIFNKALSPLRKLTESQKRPADSQQDISVPSLQEKRLRTCYGTSSPIKSIRRDLFFPFLISVNNLFIHISRHSLERAVCANS
jgi:hypothetical protein